MNDFMKNTLKLIQILCILLIPPAIVQFYFPQLTFLGFVEPFNKGAIGLFSNFTSMQINGVDWSVVFIIIPWVLMIIVAGVILNFIEKMEVVVEEKAKEMKMERTVQKLKNTEQSQKEKLHQKNMVYVTISVIFSKFTISNFSEREIEEKKEEVKKDLIKDLASYRGKVIEDEAFDDDDTFAVLFFDQDDALSFLLKFKELIAYYDNVTQSYGYSIDFKAIADSQPPSAMQFYVLQFMEKALRAIGTGEICTTKDFTTRYEVFGKMKQLNFLSKGNYSINKARVELFKLEA